MKNVVKYISTFIGLIIFFVITLTGVAAIPTELIKNNVKESATTLSEEEEYYTKQYFNKLMLYDNYTDAIMINNAYSMDPAEPLYSALIVRRNYIPGVTIEILPEETGTPTRLVYETDNLMDVVQGKRILAKQYPRYWHGYLIFLKPLLILFNYSQIRIVQLILIIVLTAILIYLIYKKIGLMQAIIFLLGFMVVDIQYIYMCLEFTPIFIVMLCVSIFMLISEKRIKDKGIIFFVAGMLSCFFDFLTAPTITLGIPLLIYFLLKQKEENLTIKEILKIFIVNCLKWFLGYALTWVTKFLLVDIIYNKGLLATGLQQVAYRTLEKTSEFKLSYISSLSRNFRECSVWIFAIFCIIQILFFVYKEIRINGIEKTKNKNKEINSIKKEIILPYILIALIPLLWYFVLQEHSIRHGFFTYRATSTFWIGIMLVINLMNPYCRGKDGKNK